MQRVEVVPWSIDITKCATMVRPFGEVGRTGVGGAADSARRAGGPGREPPG
jgi:hypothetical protein